MKVLHRVGLVGFATIFVIGSVIGTARPVYAAEGDVVCEANDGDSFIYRVIDNGDFTFRLQVLDGAVITAESNRGDYYITLPTTPTNLRYATATVDLGSSFEITGTPELSQGITTSAPTGALPFDYTLVRDPAAPGESSTIDTPSRLTWIADLDIRETVGDGRSVPSDFFFQAMALDASTSVLELDFRPVTAAPTGVDLVGVAEVRTFFNTSVLSPETDRVEPTGEQVMRELGGCTIPAALLPPTPTPEEPLTVKNPTGAVGPVSAAKLAPTGVDEWALAAPTAFAAISVFIGTVLSRLRRSVRSRWPRPRHGT